MSWECADPYHPRVALPPGRGWLGHCAVLRCGARHQSTETLFTKSWVTPRFWPLLSYLFLATTKKCVCPHRWCTSQPRILTSCCSYCFAVASLYPALLMGSCSTSRQTSTNWRSRRYALHLRLSGSKTSFSWEMFACIFTSKLLLIIFAKSSIWSNDIFNKGMVLTFDKFKIPNWLVSRIKKFSI